MARLLPLLLGAILLAVAAGPGFQPGDSAEALRLQVSAGPPVDLMDLAEVQPLLLIPVNPNKLAQACKLAAELATRIPVSPLLVLPGTAPRSLCVGDIPSTVLVLVETGGSPMLAEDAAVLIDESLHVRLRVPLGGQQISAQQLIPPVERWLQGRQIYEVNCGHCHGFDGAQASAPETKSLVGITRKYDDTTVLRLGAQFGGVDMSGWNDPKKETLLVYLRGL